MLVSFVYVVACRLFAFVLLLARSDPKRYRDLMEGLTGIGTNLLAERLRQLEAAGLVAKQTLPPPPAPPCTS